MRQNRNDEGDRRRPGPLSSARGFSLIEVLVGLAIVVTMATVVTPNVVGMLDRARVDRAIVSLESLNDAVSRFDEDVNRPPASLTQLVEPISSDQTSGCGKSYPPGLAEKWAGPYLNRIIPADGLPIAVGMVSVPIESVDDGSQSSLRFQVVNVAHEDALELQRRVDGDENPMVGAIRFTEIDEEGLVVLYYHLPLGGC